VAVLVPAIVPATLIESGQRRRQAALPTMVAITILIFPNGSVHSRREVPSGVRLERLESGYL
jgi:hypothetical protein